MRLIALADALLERIPPGYHNARETVEAWREMIGENTDQALARETLDVVKRDCLVAGVDPSNLEDLLTGEALVAAVRDVWGVGDPLGGDE